MTQKQINTLYNLTILIHEHEWFGKRKNQEIGRKFKSGSLKNWQVV